MNKMCRQEELRSKTTPEVLDHTPVELPAHMQRPPTLHEIVATMVRNENVRKTLNDAELDTPDQFDDFDLDDEDPVFSIHQGAVMADELENDEVLGPELSSLDGPSSKAEDVNTDREPSSEGDDDTGESP